MGRAYQDEDPLHGNGKAEPKPKRATNAQYQHHAFRAPRRFAPPGGRGGVIGLAAAIAMSLGLSKGGSHSGK